MFFLDKKNIKKMDRLQKETKKLKKNYFNKKINRLKKN